MQVMQVTSSNDGNNLLIAVVVVHIFSETDPRTFTSMHYIHMLFWCGLCLLTIESHNIAVLRNNPVRIGTLSATICIFTVGGSLKNF